LISKEILYTIPLTYVTFAALVIGEAYVIDVDYKKYIIVEFCYLGSNQRKSVV
jgi:hypothetical protein